MPASTLHRPVQGAGPSGPVPRPHQPAPQSTSGAAVSRGAAGLTVGRKLACLAALGVLGTGVVATVAVTQLSAVDRESTKVTALGQAHKTLLKLDTRSSELKVDAYTSTIRPNPADERDELKDDVASPTALLADLDALPLDGALADQVAAVRTSYTGYVSAISSYVESAVADQAAARARYADVAAANTALDDALGTATDTVAGQEEVAVKRLDDTVARAEHTIETAAVLALAGLVALAVLITRRITTPLRSVRAALDALAEGDLTQRADVASRDEIGEMARALTTAQESLGRVVQAMAGNATALAAAAEEMSATAGAIAASADETSAQSGIVSAAAEQVSRNVQTVATGADEMGASIREISQNADEAARVGSSAVGIAESTNATVARLGESSREIGDVVKTITSIAEQTNLLALNATIEAARAGEAGKGFAVVANEVKDLAQETAKATEDISRRVDAIQADTAGAVTAIGEIATVIARMNDFQTTIASAVEEQTATTAEMARNVSEAALGSSQIAENIVGVATAASTTSSGVQDTQTAAGELARMSNELQTLVNSFRC